MSPRSGAFRSMNTAFSGDIRNWIASLAQRLGAAVRLAPAFLWRRRAPPPAGLLHAMRAFADRYVVFQIITAVIVSELIARLDAPNGAQQNALFDDLDFHVRLAGVIGVARDVGARSAV